MKAILNNYLLSYSSKRYCFFNYLIFIILFFLFLFPNGGNTLIDGLPFNKSFEKIFFFLFLIIFTFKTHQLNNKYLIFLIFLTLLLKIFLLFESSSGLNINIYDQNNEKIKDHNTLWDKDTSSIQNRNWHSLSNFPIEWINYTKKEKIAYEDFNKYYQVNPTISFDGYFYNTSDVKLEIIDRGKSRKKINIFSDNNLLYKYEFSDEIYLIPLKKGNFQIKGTLIGVNDESSLIFNIIKNGSRYDAFLSNYFHLDEIEDVGNLVIFEYLFNIFIILITFILIFSKNYIFIKQNLYILIFITFSSLVIIVCKDFLFSITYSQIEFIKNLNDKDNYGSFIIVNAYFFYLILFCYLYKKKIISHESSYSISNYSLLLLSTLYFYFLYENYLFSFTIYDYLGDDWIAFKYYSRDIIENNAWIRAGEDYITFRYLIRHIIAISKLLFDHTDFVFLFLESFIITMSIIFFGLIVKNYSNNFYTFLFFKLILIFFYFGESYRWLIGKGLSEYFALFSLCLSSYYFLRNKINNISNLNIITIGLVSAFGILLREDHFFIHLFLILLSLKDISLPKISICGLVIRNFKFQNIIFKKFFIYFSIIFSSLIFLYLRNYFYAGGIDLLWHINKPQPSFSILDNIYRMISGSDIGLYPRTMVIILLPSLIISLFIIFFKKTFDIVYITSILVLACILPYLVFGNYGYAPRFTIHYIYICILFIYFLFNSRKYFFKS